MKTLEKELEIHFGDRLEPLTAQDPLPVGVGSPIGKLVETECTIVFCKEGFVLTTPSGESATCRYGDPRLQLPDLKGLMDAGRAGFGFIIINRPPTLTVRVPATILTGARATAARGVPCSRGTRG